MFPVFYCIASCTSSTLTRNAWSKVATSLILRLERVDSGGADTGIRGRGGGRGTGVKGAGERGRGSVILGSGGYTKICCILPILLHFYVLQCNNWVSEVSNRRIGVNSGIFTMNPALISFHRRGVFRRNRGLH